jgi:glycosyltransferase involved in cell wall biosynthesis
MLRHLAERYNVTLISFVRPEDKSKDIAHLARICDSVYTVPMVRSRPRDTWALLKSIVTRQAAVIIRDDVPEMRKLLLNQVRRQRFDLIHADQTSMAQYGLFASKSSPQRPRPITALDQHNALYLVVQRHAHYEQGVSRFVWKREWRRLADYEANLCRLYDHLFTVTGEDRQALLRLLNQDELERLEDKITPVPICIDPSERLPVNRNFSTMNIVHLGTMFWPPNVEGVMWFALEVLPKVIRHLPDAQFTIAGKDPPHQVQVLAKPGSPVFGHVEITGYVSDPERLLEQCSVFVVPVRSGGGMRVKILDAWSWGLPVVSTSIGAEGIMTRPGENILIADDADAYASAVITILTDSKISEALSVSGRNWVERHYDWRKVYIAVDEVYRKLLAGR